VSVTDAPDYTLLADVNVVGSVTLNVNVVGSVQLNVYVVNSTLNVNVTNTQLNVNITGSQVTLDVNIYTQTVDVKIYTPSGRWVTASDLVSTYIDAYGTYLPAGQETTLISVTGKRGRLKNLGIWASDGGAGVSIPGYIYLRIYVDGSLKANIPLGRLDFFMGFPADWLRKALGHALFTGIAQPFNTARVATNPDKYLVMPFLSGPRGTMTYLIYDATNVRVVELGGYLEIEFEFMSSLTIKMYNSHTSATLMGGVVATVGEYP
jgi:hypothetical protein